MSRRRDGQAAVGPVTARRIMLDYWPRFARDAFGPVLGFYLASSLVLVGPLLLWYLAMTRTGWLIIPAALVGTAALFVYARLLGRVGWALVGLNPRRKILSS